MSISHRHPVVAGVDAARLVVQPGRVVVRDVEDGPLETAKGLLRGADITIVVVLCSRPPG